MLQAILPPSSCRMIALVSIVFNADASRGTERYAETRGWARKDARVEGFAISRFRPSWQVAINVQSRQPVRTQVELWQVYRIGSRIETVERQKPTVLPSRDKSHRWTLLCELLGFNFRGMDRFWCGGGLPGETWSGWSQLVCRSSSKYGSELMACFGGMAECSRPAGRIVVGRYVVSCLCTGDWSGRDRAISVSSWIASCTRY